MNDALMKPCTVSYPRGFTAIKLARYFEAPEALVSVLLEASPNAESAVVDEADEKKKKAKPSSKKQPRRGARLKLPRAIMGVLDAHVLMRFFFKRGADAPLPLHDALKDGSGDEEVLAALSDNPRRAAEKDAKLSLPVHVAARMKASVAVVEALLSAFPPGVSEKNKLGYTPLHLAVGKQAPLEVVAVREGGIEGGRGRGRGLVLDIVFFFFFF